MDHIDSDYEKDMEANWAMVGLEREAAKALDRQKARADLLVFLRSHPEFQEFYLLLKAVEKY